MKTKLLLTGALSLALAVLAPACKKDKSGCTDPNADNYDSNADKNADCRYRHASNIDVSGVPATKSDGSSWDDGNGPDLRLDFGRSANTGYDHTTNTAEDAGSSATLMPSGDIKYTNEPWKYQLVDVDLVGNEVIVSGSFNPLSSNSNNTIEIQNNGVTIKFKYTIQNN